MEHRLRNHVRRRELGAGERVDDAVRVVRISQDPVGAGTAEVAEIAAEPVGRRRCCIPRLRSPLVRVLVAREVESVFGVVKSNALLMLST